MASRCVPRSVNLTGRQDRLLRLMAGATKVPANELIRQAVDLFLEMRGAIAREDLPGGGVLPRAVRLCSNPSHGVHCCREAA